MANSSKVRQPRLRASCDGCFLAKVKCSKARPICTRCLTCGIECRYSPSSRAGKPKASETAKNQHHHQHQQQQPLPPVTTDGLIFAGLTGVYRIETGWNTPPTSVDDALSRHHSTSSGLTFMGVDNAAAASSMTNMDAAMPGDMYGPTMPWTPPSDVPSSAISSESPITGALPLQGHSRSYSHDMGGTGLGWMEPSSPDIFTFNPVTASPSVAPSYFSSPTATPHQNQTHIHSRTIPLPRSKSTSAMPTGGGSCTCFTLCLQSLQALHNAASSAPPPFDLVLSLNRMAVEGCAAMLVCTKCMNRSGTQTSVMLLATVLGTITAFYKSASESYFDLGSETSAHQHQSPTATANSGLGISLGAYTVCGDDGRWLELEILSRELRKLEEVYAGFRDACGELLRKNDDEDDEDGDENVQVEVSKAMVAYLGQSLGSTMRVVAHCKGERGGSGFS